MICDVCERESTKGKTYTLTPEASKIARERLHVEYPQQTWICDDCLANPVRRFAETLLSMWDIFPLTQAQKINRICEMFKSGGIRLPKGISLKDIENELKWRRKATISK
jgi:hypothetical protein